MCLRPLRVGNPTRRFVAGLSRPLVTCRCNRCAECVQAMQDEWFVRAVFETKRVQSRGGAVWVPIFTYRNEDLPRWIDNDPRHPIDIPCFDKSHFRNFRNKFRTYLNRDIYMRNGEYVMRRKDSKPKEGDVLVWKAFSAKGENTIRYIYCCEYGDKKGRSHIHPLLFVPFYVPAPVMRYLIDTAWTYGMVRYSKDHGMIAKGMFAAQYAMKYVVKDMNWMKRYNIDDYVDKLKEDCFSRDGRVVNEEAKEKLNAFRRVMPHHCQSMGFGVDGVDYFKNEDGSWNIPALVDGRFDRSKLGIPPTKKGENFMYNMPMYFIRKIFYNIDEWNLYKMNELGKEIFTLRFDLSLRRAAEKFSSYTYSLASCQEHLAPLGDYNRSAALFQKITALMDGRTPRQLALFDKVYRDLERTGENAFLYDVSASMSRDDGIRFLDDNALDFMLSMKSLDVEPMPERCKNPSNWKIHFEDGFNCHPCFEGFCEVLKEIEDAERELGVVRQAYYDMKREKEKILKGFMPDSYIPFSTNLIFHDL